MSLKVKNKVAILKYKTLFEENELVSSELNDGSTDLSYHLNYFKKKLNKDIANQDKRFSNLFFRDDNNNVVKKLDVIKSQNKQKELDKKSKPEWAKRLFKKIVFITHPDKASLIKIDFLVKRFKKFYLLAVDSYETSNYQNLLMIAYDLDIPFDEKLVKELITPQIQKLEKNIASNKTMLGYQWHHILEKDRPATLETYLIKLGFIFTRDEVDKAIQAGREKNKRKVGTRPVNKARMRLK